MKDEPMKKQVSRRTFLKQTALAAGSVFSMPHIVPSSVFGKTAPGNRITFGCIGMGRMGMGDLNEILGYDDIQVVAVCDVDAWRLENAKNKVEEHYRNRQKNGQYHGCDAYRDYRDILIRSDIDAVAIVTPDHWHALPAIEAARAGKDIFLQKPLTLRINEGRMLSDTVHQHSVILQVGSQQRSDARFRFAAELVRNGRIGKLHTVKVGFGKDPFTGVHPVKPVPEELDYEFWLGPAPHAPYIEERVHPVKSYDRPGWLRTDDFCCGMITGWGSHHMDSAHWGMGTEYTGPVAIDGKAEFSKAGVWDVHGGFRIEYTYDDDVMLICADNSINKQGVVFKGTEGWVYVRRGFIDAEPKSLLKETMGYNEIHLYKSTNHKRNFFDCIRTRREPVAPVEIGHRSNTACILGYISMRRNRKIKWDYTREMIPGDEGAARLLSRPYRSPWYL
jgi:myo-inositol 2-dehydrogenase/D-chiro-inositol 1-dehydrogenase